MIWMRSAYSSWVLFTFDWQPFIKCFLLFGRVKGTLLVKATMSDGQHRSFVTEADHNLDDESPFNAA